MIDYLWLLAVAGGPLLLAGAFIYAILRQRRLTTKERADQVDAEDKLYGRKDP
ncbi:hypothetical protein [Ciceribacter sp. L1K23]|uniref:hypothetical protein n=1 Tax=Ciceribacter sp. L1K23 TaxID=2820276 RepID=UPI001BA49A20|nr:hypothetical protein [Ciceribacter sp. L1K23]